MGVRFVVGRAGSGKSLRCFRAVVEMMRQQPLGPHIYWIVPKQETFTAERELTCGSGLLGFCRAHVVSFELLGEEILAECGGTAIPQVTPLGRQMMIGHLLRRHAEHLAYYVSSARQAGLAAELDATFSELERTGRHAQDLTQIIAELESEPTGAELAPLLDKLRDLRLLYEQYTAYLGQGRLDPHRRLEQVLASLEDCRAIRDAAFFVDGFLEFSDFDRRLLVGIARVCRDMEVTLLLDPASHVLKNPHLLPDELSLFHRTEDAYRRLWFAFNEAGIEIEQPIVLKSVTRFESPALAQVEQHALAPRAVRGGSTDAITMIETPDRRAEVDAAARHVRALLDQGLRLREIAVLTRDVNEYHELIEAGFREHEIPFFVDRRRTAAHHPLVQFTRGVLQIGLHVWPHDAVMAVLKSGLAGVASEEADQLENYVLEHCIRGSAWIDPAPWSFQRNLTRSEDSELAVSQRVELERIDALRRRFAEPLVPLAAVLGSGDTLPARQMGAALHATFEQYAIRDTLQRWMQEAADAGRLLERDEHAQVWTELMELLDQISDVIGDELVSTEDFASILETGLEQFDLALTPPTVDQVLVGAVDRTRSARPRAVILLGMNETQFPRVPRESAILSDAERNTLKNRRLELDPDCQRTLLDERLLGYIALTRASQSLCLIRSIADDANRPLAPSVFWVRLREQFPSLVPQQVPRNAAFNPGHVGTPRQLVSALMRWVRGGAEAQAEDARPALYNWLAEESAGAHRGSLQLMCSRSWPALMYRNEAILTRETASRLFKSPLRASVSRIENFAACPFKHFLRYGLGLAGREEPSVTSIELGIVCHGILERIVREMLAKRQDWGGPARTMIHDLATEVGRELRGELMLDSARNQYILGHIERTIGHVIDSQAAAARRGRMVPWRAELEFGDGKPIPALSLSTPDGHELLLRGKIDRVDKLADGAAFAVIDYKYRGGSLALDHVYHGLSLQLLTYLLVLDRAATVEDRRQLIPAAAFYVKLLRQLDRVRHPDDAIPPDDPAFHLQVKPRGIFDVQFRGLFDSEHTSRASDVLQLSLKQDGTIGNRNTSDACESEEFAAMLKVVERKLVELADEILAGRIDVAPYRIRQTSPCPHCEYRSVCRFDVGMNFYRTLPSMGREQVLEIAVRGRAADGQ